MPEFGMENPDRESRVKEGKYGLLFKPDPGTTYSGTGPPVKPLPHGWFLNSAPYWGNEWEGFEEHVAAMRRYNPRFRYGVMRIG